MRIFLSYSSAQRPLAERINHQLQSEGHEVFFDREDLPAGETYGDRIRQAVERCDVFIFLVAPASVSQGSYALTELSFVENVPRPSAPAIIPVLAAPLPSLQLLPPLLAPLTLLEPQGDAVAEVAARVAQIAGRRARRRRLAGAAALAVVALLGGAFLFWRERVPPAPTAPPVVTTPPPVVEPPAPKPPAVPESQRARLVGMPTNQGWVVSFDIADPRVREIHYALDDAPSFVSTGFQMHRHPVTGLPLPQMQVQLPGTLGQSRMVSLKYTDGDGREHGPFRLPFDPKVEYVRFTRSVLGVTSWLAFREPAAGKLLASFSQLLSYKNAFREIRYSVDDESLSRSVRFTPDWSGRGAPGITDQDMLDVEIPPTSKSVAVRLIFIDGSESELKRISIRESGVSR